MPAELTLQLAGTQVRVLSSRALYWPDERTLLVADVHLGKGASLRHAGIALPGGSGSITLARLESALAMTGAERLIVLGDLVHDRIACTPALEAAVGAWRTRHAELSWALVTGNHDRRADFALRWEAHWQLELLPAGSGLGPFRLHHHPRPDSAGYVLCGHTHPAIQLRGPARQRARLPCFWFGTAIGVLPAFGALTGHFNIQPGRGDQVVVVGEDFVQQV